MLLPGPRKKLMELRNSFMYLKKKKQANHKTICELLKFKGCSVAYRISVYKNDASALDTKIF